MLKNKNFLIYDADCGFCQRGVNILQKLIGDKIDYTPSHQIEDGLYGIDKNAEISSIKFLEFKKDKSNYNDYEKVQHYDNHDVYEDATLYHGAFAIFKALSNNQNLGFVLFLYQYLPLFDVVSEAAYRIVARNRKNIGANKCTV